MGSCKASKKSLSLWGVEWAAEGAAVGSHEFQCLGLPAFMKGSRWRQRAKNGMPLAWDLGL